MIPLQPWTNRMPKMTQPNLDYIGKNVRIFPSFFHLLFFFFLFLCVRNAFTRYSSGSAAKESGRLLQRYVQLWYDDMCNFQPRTPVDSRESQLFRVPETAGKCKQLFLRITVFSYYLVLSLSYHCVCL